MAQMRTTVHTVSDILHITFYQLSRSSRRNQAKISLDRWGKADRYSIKCCPLKEGTISAFFKPLLPAPSTDSGHGPQ